MNYALGRHMTLPENTGPPADARVSTIAAERRLNNFDFLRYVLAVLVILTHSFEISTGRKDLDPLYVASRGQMHWGDLAVDFFFIISGFLITQSWQHSKTTWDYFKKRILRIYPAFIVVMLLCYLAVGPLLVADKAAWFHQIALGPVLANLLLLTGGPYPTGPHLLPPSLAINGTVWTIRYEFECYILVALLGLAGIYRRRVVPLLLFLGVFLLESTLIVRRHLHLSHGTLDNYGSLPIIGQPDLMPRLATFFLAGMVYYLYRDRIPQSPWLALGCAVIAVVSTVRVQGAHFTLPFVGTYLLMYVAFAPWLKVHNFARRGDLSYGIYLTATPILHLLKAYGGSSLRPYPLFVIGAALACGAGFLSWTFVERPFMKLKGRSATPLPSPAPDLAPDVPSPASAPVV